MVTEAIPKMRTTSKEAFELMEKATADCLDLFGKSALVAQPGTPGDVKERLRAMM